MPVYRADVFESDRFKQVLRHQVRLHTVADLFQYRFERLQTRVGQKTFNPLLHRRVRGVGAQERKTAGETADVFADRHPVIINNHSQIRIQIRRLIKRFQGATVRQGAVPEDHDHIAFAFFLPQDLFESQPCPDARSHMSGAVTVVRRLKAGGKSTDASYLPQRIEPIGATGYQFVRIGLMAGIPNKDVFLRKIEAPIERQGQLYRAEVR